MSPFTRAISTYTSKFILFKSLLFLLLFHQLCSPVDSKSINLAVDATNSTRTAAQQLLIDASTSFARVYTLPDGEVVSKLKWRNFTAIETRFSHLDLIQVKAGKD